MVIINYQINYQIKVNKYIRTVQLTKETGTLIPSYGTSNLHTLTFREFSDALHRSKCKRLKFHTRDCNIGVEREFAKCGSI